MKPSSHKVAHVQKGITKAEAEQILGSPSRIVSHEPMEILAYQAEQIGDAIYSIRVAYTDGRVSQCYLGYELCEGDCRSPKQRRSERLQLLLVVFISVVFILLYAWWKNRQ